MNNFLRSLIVVFILALLVSPVARAQDSNEEVKTEKRAQTGFKFLSTSLDARAAGMGDALTADELSSPIAMFYNPAGMARLNSTFAVAAGQTQFIADINYNMASVAFKPADGAYGVFGVSVMAVDYGEFLGTVRADNEQGYEDYENIGLSNPSPTALAVGLGYARALTDRFAVGGHVKYAHQNLGEGAFRQAEGGGVGETIEENNSTVAVDFGVLYRTGFRSLNFAMSARNFSRELKYQEENFELPLNFRLGVSMDLMDFTSMSRDMHSFRVAIDAERPRDFSENLRLGGEYTFMNTLSLRGGYAFPADEQGVSLGAGLHRSFGSLGFGADYAYTDYGVFDAVHRLALQFSF